MSDKLYAIKNSTLTALGDAVRNQGAKYIKADESNIEPFYEITINTAELEPYFSNANYRYNYDILLNLEELIGNNIGAVSKFWVECDYEIIGSVKSSVSGELICRDSFTTDNTIFPAGTLSLFNNISTASSGYTSGFWNGLYDRNYKFLSIRMSQLDYEAGVSCELTVRFWLSDADDNILKLNIMTPLEMVDAINEIIAIPNSLLILTGNCQYKFSRNSWNDFIELYGSKITSNNITGISRMFEESGLLTEVPFEINMSGGGESGVSCFDGCGKLETAPMINNWKVTACNNLFDSCQQLRNIPETFGDNWDYSYINTSSGNLSYLFNGCFSLRKIPVVLLNNLWSKGSSSSSVYYRLINSCYCLDELNGLGVSTATLTSNAFNASFSSCFRLKDMTFAVNEDDTPKTANWKSQTINLTNVGFNLSSSYLYNSGITADKEVTDDATYQALKNDPDWFARSADYARYNHDSAVRTINSLPDTSAYGTNTIKFSGTAGALTDGGAINTLTEEEIAVASAKGWSVALV